MWIRFFVRVRKFWVCFIFLLVSFNLLSQNIKRFGIEGHYGFIIPHTPELKDISYSNPLGVDLSYSSMGLSQRAWNTCNCFYYTGVNLSYHNFMAPQILGSATSLSLFFEPVLFENRKWEFTLRSGMGISYLSEHFDEELNPDNVFFSLPINFMLYINPRFNYNVSESLQLNLSFTFNHISNGGQSLPNYGMNFPMAALGASYVLDYQEKPKYEANEVEKRMHYYAELFGSYSVSSIGEVLLPSYGVSGGAYYNIGLISGLGGGFELNFDRTLTIDDKESEGLITAPYIAHHFLIGRFNFSQRYAYYLVKPDNYVPFNFFQRYSLTFQITKNFMAGVSLKAHRGIADYVDARVGVTF